MATTPAARKTRARRTFEAVASLSAARNRVIPTALENGVVVGEPGSGGSNGGVLSFAQCLHRFRKFSGEQPGKPAIGRAIGKSKKIFSTPGSKKPAPRTPRTASRRRLPDSSSGKVVAPAAAVAPPRAPLWDFSGEKNGSVQRQVQQRRRKMSTTMTGLPEPGEGRVRYLVDTFEQLLLLAGDDPDAQSRKPRRKRGTTSSATSSPSRRADEMDMASYPSAASSSEDLSRAIDSPRRNRRISGRDELQLRRCNSIGSSERSWSRKMTSSQHPFNLKTEQRDRVKEDNFVQRMRMRMMEEERLRNPLAQGLPWTNDEPEKTAKPPAKEPTEPFDAVLHSAFRAVSRARFDQEVAECNTFLEKLELEKERQQKMDEEIEIKQLRKEQVPKAHRMPDLSQPFLPKRPVKSQTVPKEPKFHPRLMRHNSKA